jgi:quercetin dioxygenase-like cupin family protein
MHGHGEAPRAKLSVLANIFRVQPVMLYNYLFPGVPHAIVLGPDEDFEPVDAQFYERDLVYRVPRRNLAFSDIAITKLTLKNDPRGVWNRHPGCEHVIPLHGTVAVEYRTGEEIERIASGLKAKKSFAHYSSEIEHRVVNTGDEPAELLVVRFYRDGPGRSQRAVANSVMPAPRSKPGAIVSL